MGKVVCLVLSFMTVPVVAQELTLTVRIRPDASVATLKALAAASEAEQDTVSGYDGVADLLRDEYGSSHEKIRAVFRSFNKDLDERKLNAAPEVDVTLPTAPHWTFGATVNGDVPMSLHDEAKLLMGDAGENTRKAVVALNPELADKWFQPVTGSVKMPYVSEYVTYRLKAGTDTRELMRRLRADPAIQSPEIGPAHHLIPSVTQLAADPSGGCSTAPEGTSSPYGAQLKQILKGDGAPTYIAIIDSGVAPNDDRFVFWKRPRVSEADSGSSPGIFCKSDAVGCNFLTRSGFPADDLSVAGLRSHGTHVAGLASGRLLPVELVDAINSRVRLMVLKVADASGYVDSGLVYDAVAYAALNGAAVVNLSIAGPPSGAIRDAMMTNKSLLFVVAAGNDKTALGSDLTSSPTLGYPARYSAELPNVISVAATDAEGTRACFSNYGSTVEIAAPGVEIESTVAGGKGTLSGTSQATPLVSLTAALLVSYGYSKTPDAIKNRIIGSGDVLPGLKGVVSSQSRLNIAKALSFRRDVVELRDHTLISGKIDAPAPIFLSGEARPVQWQDVVKIAVNYSDEAGKHSRITVVRNGKLVPLSTDLPFTQITGKDESGKPFRYAMSEVLDIVPSDTN